MRRVGMAYRPAIAEWIHTMPSDISCLEITAEHFFDEPVNTIQSLVSYYPTYVHALGLSLGTPGSLDQEYLQRIKLVCDAVNPQWISEHVAFTRSDGIDLGHLNPILPSEESLSIMTDHALQLKEFCTKPLLLENITSHIRLRDHYSETEFLNQLCEAVDCGLLLDVTNLYVNAKNHGYNPIAWLKEIDASRIVQLHIVGFSKINNRWEDSHAEAIQDEIFEMLLELVSYESLQAIIIERDHNFPPLEQLQYELSRINNVFNKH